MRRRRLLAAAALLTPAVAFGQSAPDFVLRLPLPSPGKITAAASFDALVDPVYADANGNRNEISRSLDLYRLDASGAYGLSPRFALGVLATYAANRLCCAGGIRLSEAGLTGAGLFVDWRTSLSPGSSSIVRVGYEAQRGPSSSVLPVSDGQDRVFLRSDWAILPAVARAARIGVRLDVDYGLPFEIQNGYVRALAEIAPQIPVVRAGGWAVDALATAGFLAASDARENGTIFHNRRSTSARAGGALQLGIGRNRASQVILEGSRDFASRNALSGWRLGLTLRQTFGATNGSPAFP